MKYMGSKARHAEEILSAIKQEIVGDSPFSHIPYKNWVEPFVGGANMIDKVPKSFKRYGNDLNYPLIQMFKAIQKGWFPPDNISEAEYQFARQTQDTYEPKYLLGFIGIGCSYSGKWFGGYARGNDNKGNARNYCLESKKNLLKQDIVGVEFTSGNYDMYIPTSSIVYCDPPYAGTTKYKDTFDHDKFWRWCDEQIKRGHKIFVSEYNAPDGWRCIWQKKVNNTLTKDTGRKQGVEKLFTK